MKIIFLTMANISSITGHGIYNDLMRKFKSEGHEVFIVSPRERRFNMPTSLVDEDGVNILGVRTLNVQKTNIIEKGIGQVSINYLFSRAIKQYFNGVHFDLILYSTPPIMLCGVVKYLKRNNHSAVSYLLLKDIFPQNAVDVGMLSTKGLKGMLYRYFRRQETTLYGVSDWIGCMSPANKRYLLEHNPSVVEDNVEVNPNSIEVNPHMPSISDEQRSRILKRYGIPSDKPLLIYGGNLGVPQAIPFLVECMEANKSRTDCHFVIVGNGTYLASLQEWGKKNENACVTIMPGIPKNDYDILVSLCQIGMIFLDFRFTIPNFPSRLLSYLGNSLPVLVCTDRSCDVGQIAEENGFGLWCPSNDVARFTDTVGRMLTCDTVGMGQRGRIFLENNYNIDVSYRQIMKHVLW